MLSVWLVTIGTILQLASGSIVPPLFDYDSLTQCRQDHSAAAIFCYVKVITKIDDPFRSAPDVNGTRVVQQFRRNLLDHAICVQDCEREVAALSEEDRDRLYCEEFPVEFRVSCEMLSKGEVHIFKFYLQHIFSTSHWQKQLEPYQIKYSRLINICVNNRLERRYNLAYHGYSKIEYCLENKSEMETYGRTYRLIIFQIEKRSNFRCPEASLHRNCLGTFRNMSVRKFM
uniref:(northern house mosquito) hypothetical protein n=1 Tax=Culex pipiens TaxID=7175 RepID=A0A8D8KNN3_CULPI